MWQILGKIFGSGDVVSKGIDLIDEFHTSDVELIEADAAAKKSLIETKTRAKADLITAYAPFKLAQRVIAFSFTGVYLLCFLAILGSIFAGYLDEKQVEGIKELMAEFNVGWIMMAIISFYFGGGFIESVKPKK
jgi:hypothetical protein